MLSGYGIKEEGMDGVPHLQDNGARDACVFSSGDMRRRDIRLLSTKQQRLNGKAVSFCVCVLSRLPVPRPLPSPTSLSLSGPSCRLWPARTSILTPLHALVSCLQMLEELERDVLFFTLWTVSEPSRHIQTRLYASAHETRSRPHHGRFGLSRACLDLVLGEWLDRRSLIEDSRSHQNPVEEARSGPYLCTYPLVLCRSS